MLGDSAQNELRTRFLETRPFANRRRYERFLGAQYAIGCELKELYFSPLRSSLFPFLEPTGHIRKVENDVRDLGLRPPDILRVSVSDDLSPLGLCGALFVAEGLRLMFPYFRKQAEHLGFDGSFGAQHLSCEAPLIRQRWAGLVMTINSMTLSAGDMLVMAASAERTMQLVRAALDREMSEQMDGRRRALHG
ncbi:hypothetical protein [Agrobacterium vitis]|uniref:Heme oxygenase n=2 Tax=Agrobacterium vitis TaxID=373 RepID=A0AAE2RFR5_AGRVI|nr:hypothetical protein [Agrobacterium vitis]MBF2717683.1 hypothetical protein [Agrobacterium vitis]